MVVAPQASKCRARSGALLSRTKRRTKNNAPMPIGTFTKKTHSQPTYSVRMPPSRTPMAAPEPATAPSTPSALLRSLPSSNVTVVIENTDGERIAAAAPWSMRATTRTPADHASPQRRENPQKKARPNMKMMRRPSSRRHGRRAGGSRRRSARSPRPPTAGRFSEKSRSSWIDGRATFTMERSSTTIRYAMPSTARAFQR